MAGAIVPAAAAVLGVGAYNKYQDGKDQQANLLGRKIGENALLSGMGKQLPARAGIMQSGMTMGPDGPVFNPTQGPATPARPVMSPQMQRGFAGVAFPEMEQARLLAQLYPRGKTKDDFVTGPFGVMGVEDERVIPGTAPPIKPEGPLSALGKLKADLDAGLIDKPTYESLVKKETAMPAGPGAPSTKFAFDRKAGVTRPVTDAELAANPLNFDQPKEGGGKVDRSRTDYWRNEIKGARGAADESLLAYNKLSSAIKAGAGLGTAIQLIQKQLDEKGVVRGEDVEIYQRNLPIFESIAQEFQTRSDGSLSEESKKRLLTLSRTLAKSRLDAFRANFADTAEIMRSEEVDPEQVLPSSQLGRYQIAEPAEPPGPPPIGKNGKPMKWVP